MINKNKLINIKRKFKQIDIDNFKNGFVIIPYRISGFLGYSNFGIVYGSQNPINYETFKRVWTGNDACTISWKDSVKTTQDPITKKFKVNYQLGDAFIGELLDNTRNGKVGTDESFSDYTSQETEINLEFRVSSYFDIDSEYEFMFFKFPELYGSTLFRIYENEPEFVDRKLENWRLKFKSINQEFANTGRAKQQNIMPNPPGQGFLEPMVYEQDWPSTFPPGEFEKLVEGVDYYKFFDRYISANKVKTFNRPVKKVVVKLLGVGILNSFTAFGRPASNNGSFEDFGIPRTLFPINLEPAQTPNLYRSQSSTSNFYYGSFIPTQMFMKDAFSAIKDSFTPLNKWSSQGTLQYHQKNIKDTNPIKSGGGYSFDLYGTLDPDGNLLPWEPTIPTKEILTSYIQGCDLKYIAGGKKKIHDHLFDAYWTQKNMKTLPANVNSSLGFGWTVGSALGASVTKQWYMGAALIAVGIIGNLVTKLIAPRFSQMNGLISAELVDLNEQYSSTDPQGLNNLSMNILLSQSEDNPSSVFFDGSTVQTSFTATLTDRLESKRIPKPINTVNIGQTTYEDGTNIFPTGEPFKLNGDTTLLPPSQTSGFIIDTFQIQAIFNGEISVEFLDENDEVIWNGIYQSEGKWSNSLREIWTEKQTSIFNRENMFFNEPLPYPKPLPPIVLPPINPVQQEWDVSMTTGWFINAINGGNVEWGNSYLVNRDGLNTGRKLIESYTNEFETGYTIEQINIGYEFFIVNFSTNIYGTDTIQRKIDTKLLAGGATYNFTQTYSDGADLRYYITTNGIIAKVRYETTSTMDVSISMVGTKLRVVLNGNTVQTSGQEPRWYKDTGFGSGDLIGTLTGRNRGRTESYEIKLELSTILLKPRK